MDNHHLYRWRCRDCVVVDMKDLQPAERQALTTLYLVIAALASYYAGRMQSDMAVARIRSAYLVRHIPGMLRTVEKLVDDDRDFNRGSAFMLTLGLLGAGISSIAVAVLLKDVVWGRVSYAALGCGTVLSLHFQVLKHSREARKRLFR